MKLRDIDTEAIQGFLNAKKEDELSWWTRCDLKNILSSIFTQAEDWKYWHDRNPTARTKLGRKRWKRERRILRDEEFRRLLALLPALIRLMIMTAVSTGMRVSEVLGLKWALWTFSAAAFSW
jgi:integrase